MLARRIIPCLDVADGRVVKGVHFQSLRDAGDPVLQAARYDAEGADEIVYIPAFAAVVAADTVTLSEEHDRWEWLPLSEARARVAWPRERRGLEDIEVLLAGRAGPLEDVLRVLPDL